MIIYRLTDGIVTKESVDRINFDYSCDVLTVGAGCAGIYAADAAGRTGVRVILMENSDAIGGMHVVGCVAGYYYGLAGGSYEQDDIYEWDERFDPVTHKLDVKQLKQQRRLRESGALLLIRHTPTGVVFDGTRVVGIEAFDGERTVCCSAKIVIDATSDGHIIRMCDVKLSYGKETDGKRAPFSVISRYTKEGRCIGVNKDAGYVNQYDVQDFSRKVMEAHRNASELFSLGEYLHMAGRTGVREGISFEGEEKLTYEDVLFARKVARPLFYAYSDFDRHGSDKALYEEIMQNWWVISNLATVTAKIAVPLGAVVPKGISGLVSAGRCLSADSHVRAAVRMNRDMFRMGECVGTAAALSARDGCPFAEINYAEYLTRVGENGCFDNSPDKSFGFDFPARKDSYTPVEFDINKTFHLLSTEAPGVAVWSAYTAENREEVAARLYAELNMAEDTLYRDNLAIALGIIGDGRALPTLRDIIVNRDCFYFKDCRRSNQFRSAIAACLLGRIGTEEDIPLLWEIAFSDEEITRSMYHTLKPDYLYYVHDDKNFVYYELFTHSVSALCKIYSRYGIDTAPLHAELCRMRDSGLAARRIIKEPRSSAATELCDFLDFVITKTRP